ncbi:bifunctional transcriptional activator/DNA repair enzyme AdaA [Cohnella sp.]|uniref:bifunctional transcriptional activator/DNA repair enzyme AdaA n=1 Tax=Cohnella sp. TaxID=1883426 RepID=UPI003568B68F
MERQLFDRVYEAVVNRETTYEGIYYTAVRSTKIVCRPTCRAKTPLAVNVTFYPSLEAAVRAGYRPCKRCKPEENGPLRPDAVLAEQTDAIIGQRYREKLTLQVLADSLAISPYHLQRVYKQVRGYSPQEKTERVRLEQAKKLLRDSSASVADIGESVGYASPPHFTAWFCKRTGVLPTEYRSGHRGGNNDG